MINNKKVKKLNKFIDKYIKKIPERYNQCELLTELFNDDIDHYISLSNRQDGKTYGYIKALLLIAIDFDIYTFFVVRKYTLRVAMLTVIENIIFDTEETDSSKLFFRRSDDYITVIYNEKEIAVISDINNSTDLKQYSQFLKKFPLIVYDEFIASKGDYSFEEWDSLQSIYTSVDRDGRIYEEYLNHPKIIYLGNTENFDSPVIAHLKLFNILENHELNTMKQYDNVLIEMRLNKNANENTNSRAFNDSEHAHKTAQFKTNNYLVEQVNMRVFNDRKIIYIKLNDNYLEIDFSIKNNIYNLAIVYECDKYDFNLKMSDNTPNSIYLDESFYKANFYKKYENNLFNFKNYFSKKTILDEYIDLNILKCIKLKMVNNDNEKQDDEILKINEKEIMINKLSKRFEG